jgi:hypothetical protein
MQLIRYQRKWENRQVKNAMLVSYRVRNTLWVITLDLFRDPGSGDKVHRKLEHDIAAAIIGSGKQIDSLSLVAK